MRTQLQARSQKHVPATVEELERRLAALEGKVRYLDPLREEVGKLKIEVEEMREA